jgi:riboflavin synthase
MFTGIIHEMGTVVRFDPTSGGARLEIRRIDDAEPLTRGESIAVNGVCLTALPLDAGFAADLSGETLKLTTLGRLHEGARVNLERAMAMGDRLGGHLVQGHVDAVGRVTGRDEQPGTVFLTVHAPAEVAAYLVPKGSITIDGCSLTIVDVADGDDGAELTVGLIPHTLAVTTFEDRAPGDRVNLEADVIAKYVERLVGAGADSPYIPPA